MNDATAGGRAPRPFTCVICVQTDELKENVKAMKEAAVDVVRKQSSKKSGNRFSANWSTIGWPLIIGFVLLAIGTVWTGWRERRSLSLEITATTDIVESATRIPDVVVTHKGKPITSLTRLDVLLANDGSTPIRDADFATPLSLRIKGDTFRASALGEKPVLDAWLLTKNGVAAGTELSILDDSVNITPKLLNPGDSVGFVVLTSVGSPTASCNARVVGVGDVPIVFGGTSSQSRETYLFNVSYLPAGLFFKVAFGLLFCVATVGSWAYWSDVPQIRRDYRSFLDSRNELEKASSRREFVRYVQNNMQHISADARMRLEERILSSSSSSSDQEADLRNDLIKQWIRNVGLAESPAEDVFRAGFLTFAAIAFALVAALV